MSVYNGYAVLDGKSREAQFRIEKDVLAIRTAEGNVSLDFSDIKDIRLLNYHIFLSTDYAGHTLELERLGGQTEEFFDNLWDAYNKRCEEALFLSGAPLMRSEGDYEYKEQAVSKKSKAKLAVFADCLCILPHDAGGRRIPFCFCESVVREGFWLTLSLDTGEVYRIGRLGSDTDPFFERIMQNCSAAKKKWQEAHKALDRQYETLAGEGKVRLRVLAESGCRLEKGLFSGEDSSVFWCLGLGTSEGCMELFTGENTAAYLYALCTLPADEFLAAVRHAMEAVGTHRELIFMEEAEFAEKPLYKMAAERNRYVRFLRSALSGRLIHTGSWAERVRAVLG